MNRRSLLSMFAALPFVGSLVPAKAKEGLRIAPLKGSRGIGEGVTLKCRSHPYAVEGERVTCENGHYICEFMETVDVGQWFDPKQLGNWAQEAPHVGQYPIPGCAVCGAKFSTGALFHIEEYWRGLNHEGNLINVI
jgi:hypothetical protein